VRARAPRSGMDPLTTVLIIDNDLALVLWLGDMLAAAAYSTWPAKSVPDAALLIAQFQLTVDVLAINPTLTGALDFISALRRSQQDVRVIAVLDDPRQAVDIPALDAAHARPTVADEMAKAEWLECIERVLCSGHRAAV